MPHKLTCPIVSTDSQTSGDGGGRPREAGKADSGLGAEGEEVKGVVERLEASIPQERH